jgi:hypothetical protein
LTVTLAGTYPVIFATTPYMVRNIVIENVTVVKAQRGSMVILNTAPPAPTSGDLLSGMDTVGWPPEEIPWAPYQRVTSLVTNSFTTYNFATDVRRLSQAKVFSDPEVFAKTQNLNFVINSTPVYNPASDVTLRRGMAKYFQEPEVFIKPRAPFPVTINFTPYVPGVDVRRAPQARWYTDAEVFIRQMPFNRIITDGTAAPPATAVPEFGHGIDIYDYLNGSILVAWGAFTPPPQSYNIYVNGVFYANTTHIQIVISGLTIASYNPAGTVTNPGNSTRPQNMPPNGIVSLSKTYNIKVVAVSLGLERGEIDRNVTPGPTSQMLLTSMKRLWPFPNTGLD